MSALNVEGRTIEVRNLDKVLYPEAGFTKAMVIDYYVRISPVLLPHLHQRPITMKRYPDGVNSNFFYEKQAPKHTPPWIKTVKVASSGKSGNIDYILLNDLPSLVWSANMANLELHTMLARAPKIEVPAMVVFDLDPGPPANVLQCAQVALWLKDALGALGLESWIKTSGSKGMQMYVPLNTPTSYQVTRPFANALAEHLEQHHPEMVVSSMAKNLRTGKVFIDWSQNAEHKTTISVYSLRAKEKPFVSMPVKWQEVENALKKGDPDLLYFEADKALERAAEFGDLFAPLLTVKQKMPSDVKGKLEKHKPSRSTRSMAAYRAKRDFTQTREPPPAIKTPKSGELMYVIQKHEATRLHYDFRLEMQGVLKSWAVPKGPPTTRLDKRMAVHVEDHPMDYAKFEGTIPSDNYGAGTVMVWDIGTYTNKDGDILSGYHKGKLHLILEGEKLNGEWVLVRIGKNKSEENKDWLLMKAGTAMKPISKKEDDRSVLSGRTMKQIEEANDAQWISHKRRSSSSGRRAQFREKLRQSGGRGSVTATDGLPQNLPNAEPRFIEPMKCKPVTELPEGPWLYEVKFDGYRAVVIKNGKDVRLISRKAKDLGKKYPEIVEGMKELPLEKAVIDGEVVAVDEKGVPSFQLLQNLGSSDDRPLCFYAFDLMNYNGKNTMKLPLEQRKKILEGVVAQTGGILLFSAGLKANPHVVTQEIRKRGLEGVIAKKKDSLYEPGKRSGSWVKMKTDNSQEFVVGGYRPSGKQTDFDVLLIGYYEDGKLQYAGKLRAGFAPHDKKMIASKFPKLVTKRLPFANLPEETGGRWGQGITEEDLTTFVWLKPNIVCQVDFVEWTVDNHLRHPKFTGLREDKDASEVVRET